MRIRILQQRNHAWFKFAIVGGIGFMVDAITLILLFDHFQLDLVVARPLAFVCAATSNWILNRLYTFADLRPEGRKSLEWMRFVFSAILSAIPNLGVFFLLMQILPETFIGILAAMVAGILTGYYCNYSLARRWVYRPTST